MKSKNKNVEVLIAKTSKLFIGGEFVRTESARSYPINFFGKKNVYCNVCQSSRKDFRNAVSVAIEAQKTWNGKSAFNRAQILYRLAEMLQSRKSEFCSALKNLTGETSGSIEQRFQRTIDNIIYVLGWSDKYQQVAGSINPVSGPHFNTTITEATGNVAILTGNKTAFDELILAIANVIVTGNTCTVLVTSNLAGLINELGEILSTCDLPKGVVNLLSGRTDELLETVGSHMEINSIWSIHNSSDIDKKLMSLGAENVKRFSNDSPNKSIESILQFVEYKTIWHPLGY